MRPGITIETTRCCSGKPKPPHSQHQQPENESRLAPAFVSIV